MTLARQALRDPDKHDPTRYDVCDHATPVLYGAEEPRLEPAPGRSPALETRDPRLHRIAELTSAEHQHFVGRTWQLARPADAVFRTADADFTGPERLERLSRNLVRALRDEPILLVLDNFETNLKPQAEASAGPGEPAWACQDPTWDRCLATLATDKPQRFKDRPDPGLRFYGLSAAGACYRPATHPGSHSVSAGTKVTNSRIANIAR